jgi:hypothetical protein
MHPLLVPVVKATFSLMPSGELAVGPVQVPLCLSGERWGKTGMGSYRYEPEGVFFKPATDVVLVGHAWAPRTATRELLVSLRLGPVRKVVRVLGERTWVKSLGRIRMTEPFPFERIPLQ